MISLIQESGFRWMTPTEQFQVFPSSRELRPYTDRPVWLVISIAMREFGYQFRNGLGVTGQMRNIRQAIAKE